MQKYYRLSGLGCANCAAKIEEKVRELPQISHASMKFVTETLDVEYSAAGEESISAQIEKIVHSYEPDVVISEITGSETKTVDDKYGKANRKPLIFRLAAAAILTASGFLFGEEEGTGQVLFLIAYLLIGYDVILLAFKNILHGMYFEENFLMSIATIGAVAIREYPEAAAVMLFYQLGELFQSMAVDHSKKSIRSLLEIRPDYANIKKDDAVIRVNPVDVRINDQIIVKAGERVPLDGIVTDGTSLIDTSALTGESIPREVTAGDCILSGTINQSGMLTVLVTKEFGDSTVSRILDLVKNASDKKAPTERFITKFSKIYTPVVVGLAVLIAILPPIFNGFTGWSAWLHRGLVFLVVSCPCALVLSIPLGFLGGIGSASRKGILIKGSNYLEVLNHVGTVVFDKTGTLTEGVFKVTKIRPYNGFSEAIVLENAAYAEANSSHPIARSILKAYEKDIERPRIQDVQETSGHGVKAVIDGKSILVGNSKFMQQNALVVPDEINNGTLVHTAMDNIYTGSIQISDNLKPDSKATIQNLKNRGIEKIVMLTGDNESIGRKIGTELNLDQVYSNLLPEQKVEKLEEMLSARKNGKSLIFVGDGINDAPVLARADVGIAMGGLGSDAAIEAADIVIMTDEPSKIVTAIQIADKTNRIVKENIFFSLGVKGTILVLGALGLSGMWEAVFADVGVMLLAVVNSMRLLR
ncbi:MAG: heavy metal translocating P-type ATPase [Flexilinea sp.]